MIAQGIVTFPDGAFRWDDQRLGDTSWPHSFVDSPPVFLVANGPDGILVTGVNGPAALLEAGEATFLPAGSTGSAAPRSSARRPAPTGSRSSPMPDRRRSRRASACAT